jgi:CheY-like chemotaxis protein
MTAILVVEGEPAIREVTAALLGRCGFVLHTAAGPQGALAVVERHRVDVVLTDVLLPGRSDGCSMARQLRRRGWSGGIIFTSWDRDVMERARLTDERAPFLPKPYGRQMLLGAIDELDVG